MTRRKGLLPCPHCGGRAGTYEDWAGWWQAQCDECGATTLKKKTEEECVESWNHRVPPSEEQIVAYIEKTHAENREMLHKLKKKHGFE